MLNRHTVGNSVSRVRIPPVPPLKNPRKRGFFNDNGKENHLDYSYQGNTCFIKVPCRVDLNSKAKNQALRNVYETKTGQSANPGQGPANLIRSFAGIRVPKGAAGGKRTRKKTRKYRR